MRVNAILNDLAVDPHRRSGKLDAREGKSFPHGPSGESFTAVAMRMSLKRLGQREMR